MKRPISDERLAALESGTVESANHAEQMAMQQSILLARILTLSPEEVRILDGAPFIARLRLAGSWVGARFSDGQGVDRCWISDTVRGWFAMAVDVSGPRPLARVIDELLPYARDHHFAVREWAWLALRPRVIDEPLAVLRALSPLVDSDDPRVRRFALEATRPRSVWGGHVSLFKQMPELGEPALRQVRCDDSRYVRIAASNWINDAARSRPDWVRKVTSEMNDECSCPATRWISNRGSRTLKRDIGFWTPAA